MPRTRVLFWIPDITLLKTGEAGILQNHREDAGLQRTGICAFFPPCFAGSKSLVVYYSLLHPKSTDIWRGPTEGDKAEEDSSPQALARQGEGPDSVGPCPEESDELPPGKAPLSPQWAPPEAGLKARRWERPLSQPPPLAAGEARSEDGERVKDQCSLWRRWPGPLLPPGVGVEPTPQRLEDAPTPAAGAPFITPGPPTSEEGSEFPVVPKAEAEETSSYLSFASESPDRSPAQQPPRQAVSCGRAAQRRELGPPRGEGCRGRPGVGAGRPAPRCTSAPLPLPRRSSLGADVPLREGAGVGQPERSPQRGRHQPHPRPRRTLTAQRPGLRPGPGAAGVPASPPSRLVPRGRCPRAARGLRTRLPHVHPLGARPLPGTAAAGRGWRPRRVSAEHGQWVTHRPARQAGRWGGDFRHLHP